jgi:D-glycero-alpha-D-manno-heptose-7-phosphate kinase
MIITRTPLRISLGGGGTDIPDYYGRSGGFLVAAAISKYVFITVNHNFDGDILLKYSSIERVDDARQARHPLLRECLRHLDVRGPIEITSIADIPAGTGLGSSGSFSVGLLRALHAHRHEIVASEVLAEEACHVEIDRLGEKVGKQDQYIATFGGITAFELGPDGRVTVRPVRLPDDARNRLEDDLLLFYTGIRRDASDALERERAQHPGVDGLVENLDAVKQLGRDSCAALEAGDLTAFARLLSQQWQLKYERAPTPVHDAVDTLIRSGIDAGALGGKLVGAGGGGFLLFYAEDKADLRKAMAAHDLVEVRFRIDYEGSTTLIAQ